MKRIGEQCSEDPGFHLSSSSRGSPWIHRSLSCTRWFWLLLPRFLPEGRFHQNLLIFLCIHISASIDKMEIKWSSIFFCYLTYIHKSFSIFKFRCQTSSNNIVRVDHCFNKISAYVCMWLVWAYNKWFSGVQSQDVEEECEQNADVCGSILTYKP